MNFQAYSLAFLVALASLSLGLFLWFFVRMRTRRLWLPTLRVLELERTHVRKLRWKVPPWLSFLLFLLVGLCFLIFAGKPKALVSTDASTPHKKVHFFLDLNPSVSAYVNLSQYLESVEGVWKALEAHSKISVSTSFSRQVFTPSNVSEWKDSFSKLDFHRAGVDLGSALKQQREKIGNVDALILFSDGGSAAWKGFNWKFLADDMKVYWFDLKAGKSIPDNVFFSDQMPS